MNCFRCNAKVIWNCDFDTEDFGMYEEGIISTYTCSNPDCNSSYEVVTLFEEEE